MGVIDHGEIDAGMFARIWPITDHALVAGGMDLWFLGGGDRFSHGWEDTLEGENIKGRAIEVGIFGGKMAPKPTAWPVDRGQATR